MGEVQDRLRTDGPFKSALDGNRINEEKQAKRAAYLKATQQKFLTDVVDDFVRRIRLLPGHSGMSDKEKKKLRTDYKEELVDCMAVNVATCRTRLTFKALERVSANLEKKLRSLLRKGVLKSP